MQPWKIPEYIETVVRFLHIMLLHVNACETYELNYGTKILQHENFDQILSCCVVFVVVVVVVCCMLYVACCMLHVVCCILLLNVIACCCRCSPFIPLVHEDKHVAAQGFAASVLQVCL